MTTLSPRTQMAALRDATSLQGNQDRIKERHDLPDGWQVRLGTERLGGTPFGSEIEAWAEVVPPVESASAVPYPDGHVPPVALSSALGYLWSRDGGETWGASVHGGHCLVRRVDRQTAIRALRGLASAPLPRHEGYDD